MQKPKVILQHNYVYHWQSQEKKWNISGSRELQMDKKYQKKIYKNWQKKNDKSARLTRNVPHTNALIEWRGHNQILTGVKLSTHHVMTVSRQNTATSSSMMLSDQLSHVLYSISTDSRNQVRHSLHN